jgi:hypothetical protein
MFQDGQCVFPPKAGCILKNKGEEVHVTSAAERFVRSIPEYHVSSITGSEYSMSLEELQELEEAKECWDWEYLEPALEELDDAHEGWDSEYPEPDAPQPADLERKLCVRNMRRLFGDDCVSEWGLSQNHWGPDESNIAAEESDVISTADYEL